MDDSTRDELWSAIHPVPTDDGFNADDEPVHEHESKLLSDRISDELRSTTMVPTGPNVQILLDSPTGSPLKRSRLENGALYL